MINRELTVRQKYLYYKNQQILGLVRRHQKLATLAKIIGEDAESIAAFGLMRAIQKFDPKNNFKLTTIAVWHMYSVLSAELKRIRKNNKTVDFDFDNLECPKTDKFYNQDEIQLFYNKVNLLCPYKRLIIYMLKYGLNHDEIGCLLNMSKQRVNRIKSLAIKDLKILCTH